MRPNKACEEDGDNITQDSFPAALTLKKHKKTYANSLASSALESFKTAVRSESGKQLRYLTGTPRYGVALGDQERPVNIALKTSSSLTHNNSPEGRRNTIRHASAADQEMCPVLKTTRVASLLAASSLLTPFFCALSFVTKLDPKTSTCLSQVFLLAFRSLSVSLKLSVRAGSPGIA